MNQPLYSYKSHPWHGIKIGDNAPKEVTAFIEIVPTDTVKYEIDKDSGYLSIDRPQKYSNIIPALYGFIPQTYCSDKVAELTNMAIGEKHIKGDGDPLDICILTEKDVTHGDIIVKARPIGGLRFIDQDQADDKIIAVLKNDMIYSQYNDIKELPEAILDRLMHYFTTYKNLPGDKKQRMVLVEVYGVEESYDVIQRSIEDYNLEVRDKVNLPF